MIIVEYRVPMPFTLAEYRIAQLYTVAKKSKLESGDSKNCVKINVNEPYSDGPGGYGQYTNKTYYLANRMPEWMKRLLPESAAKLKEEAWNAYPYSKNTFSNPFLEKLKLEIESRYIEGPPTLANVFNLNRKEVNSRSIVMIDFAVGNCGQMNPQVLEFEPLFRKALDKDWLQDYELAYGNSSMDQNCNFDQEKSSTKNLMTCYKLCRVNFPVWPLQNRVEQFIQQYCKETMNDFHRSVWLWQDEWTGMSMEDIRAMERDTQDELLRVMRQSSLV